MFSTALTPHVAAPVHDQPNLDLFRSSWLNIRTTARIRHFGLIEFDSFTASWIREVWNGRRNENQRQSQQQMAVEIE
jgi:hypothetical protein